MTAVSIAAAAGAMAITLVMASSSFGCECPKEAMIKKYGTVSMIRHPVPLPEATPAPDPLLPLPPLPQEPAVAPVPTLPKPQPQS